MIAGTKNQESESANSSDEADRKLARYTLVAMALLSCLGLYVVWESTQLGLYNSLGVGPGMFPLASGVLMSVLGILGAIAEARRISHASASRDDDESAGIVSNSNETEQSARGMEAGENLEDVMWPRFWVAIAILVAFFFVFGYLGFVIAIGLVVFGLLTLVARRTLWFSFMVSLATAVAITIIFGNLLSMQLPSTKIPFLLWAGI